MQMVIITFEEYSTLLNLHTDTGRRGRMKQAAWAALYSGSDKPFAIPVDVLPPGWSYIVKGVDNG
jgi:hypothetical protein